ncbi:MAG: hypothetical protein IPP40_05785 [bacterium]|nr:hypothetical protein [bacterium]
MPELPEVETAVRELRPAIVGRVLRGAWANIPRQLGTMSEKELDRAVKGQRVVSIKRRGKYIVLALERGILLVHLRMTGRLFVAPTEKKPSAHLHAGFKLDDGSESLYFRDVRTLGTFGIMRMKAMSKSLPLWDGNRLRTKSMLKC